MSIEHILVKGIGCHMLEHLDKRCSYKDNTGDNKSIWLSIRHVFEFETVERVTLCAMRKSKTRKMSTLSRGNGVSAIEIPGNWQYSA